MKTRSLRHAAVAATLFTAVMAALALKPEARLADRDAPVDLETMIPGRFGAWHAGAHPASAPANSAERAKQDAIYGQVLERTYVGPGNHRVMLTIAYGDDQRNDRMQAHRPEYCYAAQGFEVRRLRDESLTVDGRELPLRRLVARQARRHEPITYWITIGDRAELPGVGRKLAQLRFGLTGTIPDGMLVRVSSLDADVASAHALQDRFIRDLAASLAPGARARLLGAT